MNNSIYGRQKIRPSNELVLLKFEFTNLDDPNFRYSYVESREDYLITGGNEETIEYVAKQKRGETGLLKGTPRLLDRSQIDELIYNRETNIETFAVWSLNRTDEELEFRIETMRDKIKQVLDNKEKAILQMQNIFVNKTNRRAERESKLSNTVTLCINCFWWNYTGNNGGICGSKASKYFQKPTQNKGHCTSFKIDAS